MKRAGRRTLLAVRKHRVGVARRMWWRYLVLLALFAFAAGVTMIWLPPMARAYFAGVYSAAWIGLIGYSLMLDGSQLRLMGAEAEGWTSQQLRRTRGWWVKDAVEFADRDVDHVAISSTQILAVETKWTSREVRIDAHGVYGLTCDGIDHAERAARRLHNLLKSRGAPHHVIPVLVLWGPNVPRIAGGYQRIGDVRVVVGKQADEWRARLQQEPEQPLLTAGARQVVEAYVARFDQNRRQPLITRLRTAMGVA